ncbi:MAG: hypothetical protein U0869_11800 [Chloroflexota bacterium]
MSQTSVSATLVRPRRFAPRAYLRAPGYLLEMLRGRERTVHLSVRNDGTLEERDVLLPRAADGQGRAARARRSLVLAGAALLSVLAALLLAQPAG